MQNIVVNNWVTQSAVASTLTNGLVAYWPLNEASGTRSDSHSNSLDLTDNNTVGQGTGNVYANAADFEEVNSEYLTRSSTDLLQPLSFSISLWIKPEDLTGAVTPLISKHDSMESEQSYILYYYPPTNKLSWAIYENDGAGGPGGSVPQALSGASPMSSGTWYHIVVTLDDQNEIQLILNDGTPFTASVTESMYQSSSDFGIGAYFSEGSPIGSSYFDGLMEATSFYNRVLTAAEITSLYNSGSGIAYDSLDGSSSLLTDLISYWALDEASGNRVDSHGSATLTDNNTVTQSTGNVYTNAAQLTRANSETLSRADEAENSFGNESFSVGCWVYLDSLGAVLDPFVSKWNSTGSQRSWTLLYSKGENKFGWAVSSNGSTSTNVYITAPSTATWYFLVGVHDADNDEIQLYIDASTPQTAAFSAGARDTTASLQMGTIIEGGGNYIMDGRMGPVFLYRKALTAAEITSLYNSGNGLEYSEL